MVCKSFTLYPFVLIILLCSLLSYSLVEGANRVYCDPDNRPDTCEEDSNPVCGTAAGCTEGICKYDLPNPCVACRDPTISYYTQGTCEYSCKDFDKSLDCAKEWLTPVCGTQRNSCGKSISKSFDNACAACKIGKATSYTIGVCKNDGGIQCSSRNRNINCLEGYTHPVCGLTRKGCNDSSCRKTFGDSCSACDDSTVKLYVDGICPGDQSVSCDDQNRPTSCSDIVPEEMVCGIFGPECTSGCLKGYPTACKACQDPRVSGYFPGGCD